MWGLVKFLLIIGVICAPNNSHSHNHWILKDNKIVPKIDSPFLLRNPDQPGTFLQQIQYSNFIEDSYIKLLHQKDTIMKHLRYAVRYGEDLITHANCALEYYKKWKQPTYLKMTKGYFKRLALSQLLNGLDKRAVKGEPNCEEFDNYIVEPAAHYHAEMFSSSAMDYLFVTREEGLFMGDKEISAESIRRVATEGLRLHPRSWKFHVLSSYYWRLKGEAKQAIQCARYGLILAPLPVKDIAMLNLGSILLRMGRLVESNAILAAAVSQGPQVAENHLHLGYVLAMKHDFETAEQHFKVVDKLDPSLAPRMKEVRVFMECLNTLTRKTSKMYSYVDYIKAEVKDFKKLKREIAKTHEKLVQQQVPLGARNLDSVNGSNELLKRGQYCSTNTQEHVLFCDFYSDMQMRLESKDVDIEPLEKELRRTNDYVTKQVTNEVRKHINLGQMPRVRAQMPPAEGSI